MFLVGRGARLLIVGQAPGRLVHETGIPWNDPSGDVLREWMALEEPSGPDDESAWFRAHVNRGLTLLQRRVRTLADVTELVAW